ncbi:unnamed protein product [Dovyalis caffra]|uniref:Abscisic acid receptor PYL4 n=1 Tax=Dovyalis caffra TaxID=77055 RepID=A0AAV1S2L1_9ROSI|nr:unnamed protein product [Dovyalis caffra]
MPANPPKSSLVIHRINNSNTTNTTLNTTNPTTTTSCQKRCSPLTCATTPVPEIVSRYHTHALGPNQCCSAVVQQIAAPVSTVWPVVRRFDNPQAYKHFVKSCHVILGDGDVGTLREVHVISGLPAANSTERLEILDDERHVISFRIVGGDHRLANYRSVTTLHASPAGNGTVVVESYLVDIPPGNTKEDTCVFVDTIVRCNLQSLAQIAENLNRRNNRSSS